MRNPENHRTACNLSFRDPTSKAKLEALAIQLGFKWGDKPNVSALVEAIAQGTIVLKQE
jgi:hypothetical protein